jgi:hypothetical protein
MTRMQTATILAERTIQMRAAMLRKKLLRGVPPHSTMAAMINDLTDAELCDRDDESAKEKVAWASNKKNKEDR